MDLKTIKGVEIFAAGKWNGDDYSVEDLDEMVRAYEENKATLKPALKLGHTDNQALLQSDGYPAAGWITNIYRQGAKLIADFIDIPEKVAALIERKAYRKVSSEIFWNIDINGKKYKRMLSAVALLGEEMPAVSTLSDILALYGIRKADRVVAFADNRDGLMIKEYSLDTPEAQAMSKTEAELKLEQDLKKAQEDAAAKDAEIETLRKCKEESDKKLAETEAKAAEAVIDASVTQLEADGLCSPAMKPYVKALLGEEKKEYSLGDKKVGNKSDLVRELLKLHSVAESVNLEETTEAGKAKAAAAKLEDERVEKVAKYAAEHKLTYGAAYRVVAKQENWK